MKLIKVAAGVLNQIPMAWKHNRDTILDAIAEAQAQRVSLLCLPELCLTGYGCEDAFYSPGLVEMAYATLEEIVPQTEGLVVSVGLPVRYQNRVYNAACLVANRKILGFVAKRYLANNGIHYELRWFQPWPQGQRGEITVGKMNYPIGDLYFRLTGQLGEIKVGYEICEDAWMANRPGRDLYRNGVDIILNPSASHFAFHKTHVRESLVVEGSRAFAATYVYANLLGNEAGRSIYDGDAMIASGGKLVTSGNRFSYADFLLTTAVVDVDLTRLQQAQYKVDFNPAGASNHLIPTDFDFPAIRPEPARDGTEAWEKGEFLKEEEFARAVALGLFDYLRKSRSYGFVVSLSGGADSSAVASLCWLMIRFGVASIGLEAFKRKLDHIPALRDCKNEKEIAHRLLSCVYQSTQNSSDDTRHSAEVLAKDLNATYFEINIDALVNTYVGMIEGGLGRELGWETDDIALQNIQSRVRSPSIWLLTNVKNALLLATGNRSEVAVGYSTMDGDTSGSISPIAGIDKHFLRQWLRWLENTGVNGDWKIKGLRPVNGLQPSAELRPLTNNQTDEEDLMPYDVLDAIEKCAIRDKQTPLETLAVLTGTFGSAYEREKLKLFIERFFRLWSRNQWKRERYAPSFHLDDLNLDPKTWCRFPILSGGFERELELMREAEEETEEKGKNGRRKSRIGF
ncbi:MAG: NAD(+) synthase [Ferruginibacter sp.]|nr:NAD(+) synthase [Cytophagales bacterium]